MAWIRIRRIYPFPVRAGEGAAVDLRWVLRHLAAPSIVTILLAMVNSIIASCLIMFVRNALLHSFRCFTGGSPLFANAPNGGGLLGLTFQPTPKRVPTQIATWIRINRKGAGEKWCEKKLSHSKAKPLTFLSPAFRASSQCMRCVTARGAPSREVPVSAIATFRSVRNPNRVVSIYGGVKTPMSVKRASIWGEKQPPISVFQPQRGNR